MKKTILITSAAIAAIVTAGPALAQTAGEGATDLGEIVVTAQKREERLQDVPLAVSVVSGDAIAASGAVNLEGAQRLIPTLSIRKAGTSLNQVIFLRGVGTSTFSIAGEPSVSSVVDGVVYSRAGEAFSDLVDVERIEVLRGPQGTLFGKNSSAGVINIVTKRPGAGSYVEAGYGSNGDEFRLRGAVDAPLGAGVQARVTGFYGTYGGNIRNLTTGSRVNGYERYGVRAIVEAEATENLTLTVIADYRKADDDCCAQIIGNVPTNLAAQVLPSPRRDKSRFVNQNLVTSTIEESGGVSLQADYDLGGHVLTYIASYREWDNKEIRDGDWLPQPYVGLNELHDFGPTTSNTLTQEIRIASPADQTFSYVLGAYYSRAETDRVFTRNVASCTLAPAPTTLTPCSAPGAVTTRISGSTTHGSVFKNYALFGQGTWNLSDSLRLLGGLRLSSDKLEAYLSRTGTAGPGISAPFSFTGDTDNTDLSGKVGIQYDLSQDSVGYLTYSRGYKGPAFNLFFNLGATGTNVIEAETSDSFEVGLKNTALDGRLILNLAAFYAKYHNFQANNPDLVAGVVVSRFTNAGTISTRGAEADFLYRPLADLTLSGGLAYTDAHINKFRAPIAGVNTGVVPSGTQLPYAPKWKGSLNVEYRIRDVGGFDVLMGAQGSFQSSTYAELSANPAVRLGTRIEAYELVDVSLGLADPDDKYRVTAVVRNLFDQSFATHVESGGPGGSFRFQIPREADRYYGVTARVNF
ncbi:MAG: TonB-dependent receptor [Phenylobacterium sp.]|uniref:TonB-dependent receptor n=1 Tax=Phenylobacterium sp. TaxID=1871053 RepID=UPI00121D48A7|nr:TonB-dependent receptor [Phenylobacterium sp.]TAL31438.1 MAG: TonB-dependent receptor [Phenylobacterium sp.]